MTKIKLVIAAFFAVFLCLSGCSAINTLGDYVSENPVFASIAARQAVARYISAGGDQAAQTERANDVNRRIGSAINYLDGNPQTTVDELLLTIDAQIDWHKLHPSDRVLVKDIVRLVELELREYEVEHEPIKDSARIAIKALLETAIDAAQIYLAKQ